MQECFAVQPLKTDLPTCSVCKKERLSTGIMFQTTLNEERESELLQHDRDGPSLSITMVLLLRDLLKRVSRCRCSGRLSKCCSFFSSVF